MLLLMVKRFSVDMPFFLLIINSLGQW